DRHPGTDPRAGAERHLRQHIERVRIEQLEQDIPGRHLFAGVVEAIGHEGSERRPQGYVGALAAQAGDGSPLLHTESGGPFEHREEDGEHQAHHSGTSPRAWPWAATAVRYASSERGTLSRASAYTLSASSTSSSRTFPPPR